MEVGTGVAFSLRPVLAEVSRSIDPISGYKQPHAEYCCENEQRGPRFPKYKMDSQGLWPTGHITQRITAHSQY